MQISMAQPEDLKSVDALLRNVLELHAALRPDLFVSGTKKYTDPELLNIFTDPKTPVLVAKDPEGNLLGYCFCQLQERRGANNMPDMTTLYIDDLCVDPQFRGAGVAKALYEAALTLAREKGCYNVTLNVWEGNDRARAFYEKMGFGVQKTMMEKIL